MKKGNNHSVYNQMQRMAGLAAAFILSGKITRARKILDTAERLFLNGNYQTKNAVSNVFVYNISAILDLHRFNVQTMLPCRLQTEYIKQINAF